MKQIFLVLFLFLNKLIAQNCKVKIDSLEGSYVGQCDNGLADGQGTATGTDNYIGKFKKGYPEGKGKYIWKNGSWYDGSWKKGLYDGEGELHLVATDRNASRDFSGFWKKGKFIGVQSQPYKINSMTNRISDVSFRKNSNSQLNELVISVYDILNGASTMNTPNKLFIPKQKLTGIQISAGSFTNKVDDEESSPYNNMYKLRGVVYPIRLLLYFETDMLDVEIFEKGNWNLNVRLENMRN
jgi:hypothetical protein